MLTGQAGGHQDALRGHLGAGVSRADDDEGEPGVSFGWVVRAVGQFDLADHVVAQVQRLGDAAETLRMFGDARDRQEFVHTAGRDQQPVVGQASSSPIRVAVGHSMLVHVHAARRAEHQIHPGRRARD